VSVAFNWRKAISFRNYIGQLVRFILSSSLVLGLIVGISLLVAGETTMEADLTFEFDRLDGLWYIVGLPVAAIVVFTILSPFSFLIDRYVLQRRTKGAQDNADQEPPATN